VLPGKAPKEKKKKKKCESVLVFVFETKQKMEIYLNKYWKKLKIAMYLYFGFCKSSCSQHIDVGGTCQITRNLLNVPVSCLHT
jgi:hypothetical protein